MKISRRDFHTTLLSASAMAQAAGQNTPAPVEKLTLAPSPAVAAGGEPGGVPPAASPPLALEGHRPASPLLHGVVAGSLRTNPGHRRMEDSAIPVAMDAHRPHGRLHRGSRRGQTAGVPTV